MEKQRSHAETHRQTNPVIKRGEGVEVTKKEAPQLMTLRGLEIFEQLGIPTTSCHLWTATANGAPGEVPS